MTCVCTSGNSKTKEILSVANAFTVHLPVSFWDGPLEQVLKALLYQFYIVITRQYLPLQIKSTPQTSLLTGRVMTGIHAWYMSLEIRHSMGKCAACQHQLQGLEPLGYVRRILCIFFPASASW